MRTSFHSWDLKLSSNGRPSTCTLARGVRYNQKYHISNHTVRMASMSLIARPKRVSKLSQIKQLVIYSINQISVSLAHQIEPLIIKFYKMLKLHSFYYQCPEQMNQQAFISYQLHFLMKITQNNPKYSQQSPKHSQNASSDEQPKMHQKKLIKRKRHFRLPQIKSVDLKHIVNVSDIWFINEQTLKDPDGSNENILRAMFKYKMITRIVLNSSFVGLELKKVDDNYLPPEYFFQRFRSLGDRQIAEIADHLQSVYIQFNQLKQSKEKNSKLKNHTAIDELNQFLKEMEGKMYTIYFIEISQKNVNLKHIFFSVMLLQKLGWNIKRVASDFLKYRHVFFQIFSPKYYKDYIQICLNNYFKSQQLQKNPTLTREQKTEMTTVEFDDEVIREVQTEHGVDEQFLKARVRFSCPNAAFCCVQIVSVDQKPTERYLKKKRRIQELIQISAEEEITLLKKLGFESSFLELDNKQQIKEIRDDLEEKGD